MKAVGGLVSKETIMRKDRAACPQLGTRMTWPRMGKEACGLGAGSMFVEWAWKCEQVWAVQGVGGPPREETPPKVTRDIVLGWAEVVDFCPQPR